MSNSTWWSYVSSIAGDVPQKKIADDAGIDKSVVTRWAQGGRPDGDFAVRFARVHSRPPIEALAAAGFITSAEADLREVQVGVSDLSTGELIDELFERLNRPNVRRELDNLNTRRLRAVADTGADTSDPDLRTP